MNTKRIVSLIAFCSFFILRPAFGQGTLTPPGAPGPTMLTLSQIEPRTPISGPAIISQSGSYYLTTNITAAPGNSGILVEANNVTLDLNGFGISSSSSPAAGYGIFFGVTASVTNLTIVNGYISGSGITNNSSGVFNGSGFSYGIYGNGVNIRLKDVTVSGCLNDGINLQFTSTAVEACLVSTVGGTGIAAQSVSDSTTANCGGDGIDAETANNCCGKGYFEGINSYTANNCYGSSTFETGVDASSAAYNCYGTSTSGDGIVTDMAENCYGSSGSGIGLYTQNANNCYGFSDGSNYGVFATYTASGCYGYSLSGIGVDALIASLCHGATFSGTALSATHNVNSF